jgi:hypothetical protein
MTHIDQGPIAFAPSAFAADGEVDEANLFEAPDDRGAEQLANAVEEASRRDLADAIDALLITPVDRPNDEGDAVAIEQAEGDEDTGTPDAVDFLDELLHESLETARAAKQVKANREKLARGGLTKAEREAIEAKVREWEARVEWDPQANVALFTRRECACGMSHTVFSGFLQRQHHRTKQGVKRWIAVNEQPVRLPNEVAVQVAVTPICTSCSIERGFDLGRAYRIDGPEGSH